MSLPSTAFVRPEFAELARVAPGGEYGRDDTGRLGFLLVEVVDDGHRLVPVRTHPRPWLPSPGGPRCPLGFTLGYPWAAEIELPLANFDPFVRKRVRNDQLIWALHDLRVGRVRLPLADLTEPASADRVRLLARHGIRLVPFAVGMPRPAEWALIRALRDDLDGLELLLPTPLPTELPDAAGAPDALPPLWASPIQAPRPAAGAYFSHFRQEQADAADLQAKRAASARASEVSDLPDWAAGRVFRLDDELDLPAAVGAAVAAVAPRTAVCHVRLPRGGEGAMYDDDQGLTARVAAAWEAARAHPEAVVLLDGLVDQDRGYWPRIGLLDRRLDPRPAYRALWELVHARPAG